MAERTCSKCRQTKPETVEYFRRRSTKDRGGLRPDCRDCSAARDRAYYVANKAKITEHQRRKRSDPVHRAYMRDYSRQYAQTPHGRARMAAAAAKWNHSEAGVATFRAATQLRRARKAQAEASLTDADWQAVLALFGGRCAYCATAGRMTQDHVVPLDCGGQHVAANVVPACLSCNSRKHTKPWLAWFTAQPFYTDERALRIREATALG